MFKILAFFPNRWVACYMGLEQGRQFQTHKKFSNLDLDLPGRGYVLLIFRSLAHEENRSSHDALQEFKNVILHSQCCFFFFPLQAYFVDVMYEKSFKF